VTLLDVAKAENHARLVVYGDIAWDVIVSAAHKYDRSDSDIVSGGIAFHPGGSAANCAVTAARLGMPTVFLGIVSSDAIGELLVEDLAGSGVDTRHLRRVDRPNAVVVAIEEAGARRRFYSYRGPAATTGYGPLPEDLFAGRGWLHLSGYSFQDRPSRNTSLELIAGARAAGWTISLDPSFHSSHEFQSQQAQVLAEVNVLLPNLEEASLISGFDAPESAARAIQERGPKVVVVKRGVEGCLLLQEDTVYSVPGFAVDRVADTIGAGDAFCAGFITGRMRGLGWREACILANAVGAHSVQYPGGHTGAVHVEALASFLQSRGQRGLAAQLILG
jgi:sugar/nucleoside kinase (ribokinase family)